MYIYNIPIYSIYTLYIDIGTCYKSLHNYSVFDCTRIPIYITRNNDVKNMYLYT